MLKLLTVGLIFVSASAFAADDFSALSRAEFKQVCMGAELLAADAQVKKNTTWACLASSLQNLMMEPDWCVNWSGPYLDKGVAAKLAGITDEEFQKQLRVICHFP